MKSPATPIRRPRRAFAKRVSFRLSIVISGGRATAAFDFLCGCLVEKCCLAYARTLAETICLGQLPQFLVGQPLLAVRVSPAEVVRDSQEWLSYKKTDPL